MKAEVIGVNSDFEFVDANIFHSQFLGMPHASGYTTKDRLVKHYEIELFLENAQFTYINGEEFPIRKNHILIAKPGQIRHSVLDFSCLYIYLDAKSAAMEQLLQALPSYIKISNIFEYTTIFQELIDANLSDDPSMDLLISSKLYHLLYKLHMDAQTTTHNQDLQQLEKAKTYIDENYVQPIQLKDIAAVANFSPTYCHKQFKKHYGQTPAAYLQAIRIAAAKKMLAVTNASMEEIALACGFNSHAYFNAVFKKCTGLPPLKYKNQCLGKYRI